MVGFFHSPAKTERFQQGAKTGVDVVGLEQVGRDQGSDPLAVERREEFKESHGAPGKAVTYVPDRLRQALSKD